MNGKLAIAGDNTETGIALLQDALKTIEKSFCLLVPTVTGALAGGLCKAGQLELPSRNEDPRELRSPWIAVRDDSPPQFAGAAPVGGTHRARRRFERRKFLNAVNG
jgi:hypothetical protein